MRRVGRGVHINWTGRGRGSRCCGATEGKRGIVGVRAESAADVGVFERVHEFSSANGELVGVDLPVVDGGRCVDGLEEVAAQDVTKTK